MTKKKQRRNKKFWTGIFLTITGTITLFISYAGYNFFPEGSWLWSLNAEIGGIGLPILVGGIVLVLFNKDIIKTIN